MVHVSMREQLRQEGWLLIAGQFPGGSDDELPPLNVVDPELARDQSPDPRRHSLGKLVPDLVALSFPTLLIVEAKVAYSLEDQEKLARMLGPRRGDLLQALRILGQTKGIMALEEPESLQIVPTIAVRAGQSLPMLPPEFGIIRARSLSEADVSIPGLEGAA
jgi:hypothetical protein